MWRWSTSPPLESPEAPASAPVARVASRDRLIVLAALSIAAGSSWLWLARAPMIHAPDAWSASYLGPALLMWALMMVAMMLPSATPMILLHARVARGSGQPRPLTATAVFALAYVALWLLFALAATLLQAWLVAADMVSEMALAVGDGRIAGALLVAAGVYQLTPLKGACLAQCRSPLSFVIRLWRPGTAGALRLGLAHGAYCIGCCWALMALLFVGGVMNPAWIGGLALLVLVEKLAPARVPVTQAAAGALILAGGVLLIRG